MVWPSCEQELRNAMSLPIALPLLEPRSLTNYYVGLSANNSSYPYVSYPYVRYPTKVHFNAVWS
jgi:hypothetical protein